MIKDGSLVPPPELRRFLRGPDAPTVIDMRNAEECWKGG
jgi:hypothetical protein